MCISTDSPQVDTLCEIYCIIILNMYFFSKAEMMKCLSG